MTRPLLLIAALTSPGCLPVLKSSLPEIQKGSAGFETTVQVRFLGVGGFMVRLGDDALMTAPLYSNPSLPAIVADQPIPPRSDLIDSFHHPTDHPEDIRAILVGHAHYDHLMDVVTVWKRLAPTTPIYGSETMENILAGYDAENGPAKNKATVALDDPIGPFGDAVDYQRCEVPQPCEGCTAADTCPNHAQVAGRWVAVPNSRIRILALCGGHPRQFLDEHKWPGCLKQPRTTPPQRPTDYPEGQVLSYLVDFLDAPGGRPVFRIYYQDAPADARNGWGMIPSSWLTDRKVDLALLCGGNWDVFNQSEMVVKEAMPKHIVIGHWEDFFVPQSAPLGPIVTLRGEEYLRRLKAATGLTAVIPAPQVLMRFPL